MGSRQRRARRADATNQPIRFAVTCRDATHFVMLTRKGRFCIPEHDLRAESVVEALGADSATCVAYLRAWRDACSQKLPDLAASTHHIMQTPLRLPAMTAAVKHDFRRQNQLFQYPTLRERILFQAAHTAQSVFELANYGDGCSCSTAIYVVGCNIPSPGCPRDKGSCLLAHVCPVFNQRYRSHRARETKISGKLDISFQHVQINIEPISFLLCAYKTGGLATWNEQSLMLLALLPQLSRKGRKKHRLREDEHVVLAAYNGRSGLRATKCIITPSKNTWVIRKWLERLR